VPETLRLPERAVVEAADEKIGGAMSDLNWFGHLVDKMNGDTISVADHVAMVKLGVTFEEDEVVVDLVDFARLLAFADEAIDCAETIADEAAKLRRGLLSLYRERVINEEFALAHGKAASGD
jgi:hypothetical protein